MVQEIQFLFLSSLSCSLMPWSHYRAFCLASLTMTDQHHGVVITRHGNDFQQNTQKQKRVRVRGRIDESGSKRETSLTVYDIVSNTELAWNSMCLCIQKLSETTVYYSYRILSNADEYTFCGLYSTMASVGVDQHICFVHGNEETIQLVKHLCFFFFFLINHYFNQCGQTLMLPPRWTVKPSVILWLSCSFNI